jgi:hypothetical protein
MTLLVVGIAVFLGLGLLLTFPPVGPVWCGSNRS